MKPSIKALTLLESRTTPDVSLILAFYQGLFKDFAVFFPEFKAFLSTDSRWLQRRMSTEGMTLALITLPKLGKALETCLITREALEVPLGIPLASDRLPQFCHCLFKEIVGKDMLPVEDEYDPILVRRRAVVIRCLRQLLMAYSKARSNSSLKSDDEVVTAFVKRVSAKPVITLPNYIVRGARALIADVVMDGDELAAPLYQWVVDPWGRHGPGAVAEKEKGAHKWCFKPSMGQDPLLYKWQSRSFEEKHHRSEPHSRLELVPKDFRSKRVICIEPKENQFAQQGLMVTLYNLIEGHQRAGRCINFRDQRPNYDLSKDPSVATIDLKDASDTISLDVCRLVLPKKFFSLVTRYRSRVVTLPNGSSVRPTCFASMGSALCFPIETLVFWAITQATLDHYWRHGYCRVFGDDIIIPMSGFDVVCRSLHQAGFVINREKSCYKTPIRESCGSWFYHEYDCRFSKIYDLRCDSLETWSSLVDSASGLIENYFLNAARPLLSTASRLFPVDPHLERAVRSCSGGMICVAPVRWNKELQALEVQQPVGFATGKCRPIPDDQALYAWLVGNDTHPRLAGAVSAKLDWVNYIF